MSFLSITKDGQFWKTFQFVLISLAATCCFTSATVEVPEPKREFRAVWVTTGFNLDWPSKAGLPVEVQKIELIEILDRADKLNLNAVVLQVRSMCDAIYPSDLEPWSYYITGKVGRPPYPYYDPLAFAIEEAHKRGVELHAWVNPYRVKTGYYGTDNYLPPNHLSKTHPWLVHQKGQHFWLDPSSKFVQDRIKNVVFDLVSRYDLDGIQIDDYFYPYPLPEKGEVNFDDDENWKQYLKEGGKKNRAEWRRENINNMIRDFYIGVKRIKPHVKVGISPSGIWKRGHPEDVVGLSSYDQIYADTRKWLQEGWLDYLAPQLYWRLKGPQSFSSLYKWWQEENVKGRHVWPGIAASRIGTDGRDAVEVLQQLDNTRKHLRESSGSGQIFWHWEAFATNRGGLSKMITQKRYAGKALTPESPWLAENEQRPPRVENLKLVKPSKENGKKRMEITWSNQPDRTRVRWWCVQVNMGKAWWIKTVLPGEVTEMRLFPGTKLERVSVRAIDPVGSLGEASLVQVNPSQ